MEHSNKIQRSEVWEQIYKVVSKIPRKDVDADAADAPSVATELEELFLKLLPIHDVSSRRELLIDFCSTKHAKDIMEYNTTVRDGVDTYLKIN